MKQIDTAYSVSSQSKTEQVTVNFPESFGTTLAKSILFSCIKCDGPLVPSRKCQVCHKASFRTCTSCGNEVPNGAHDSCNYTILLCKLRNRRAPHKKWRRA